MPCVAVGHPQLSEHLEVGSRPRRHGRRHRHRHLWPTLQPIADDGSGRGSLAQYREVTYEVAGRYGCKVVDFWDHGLRRSPVLVRGPIASELRRSSAWPWQSLSHWAGTRGLDQPLPQVRPRHRSGRAMSRGRNKHLAPWIGRRVTGRSSGDGVRCPSGRFWAGS